MIDTLDEIRERVVSGEIEAIAVIVATPDITQPYFAWRDDMLYPYPRISSAMAFHTSELLHEGLAGLK